MRLVFLSVFLIVFGGACTNRDAPPRASRLYATGVFTGDAENETVTGVFRFYANANAEEAVALQAPARFTFDAVPVQPDSVGFGGPYYEVQLPLATFGGTHTLVYTDEEGQPHRDSFSFQPMALKDPLPETVSGAALMLRVSGVPDGQQLQVLVTDTSAASPDINEELLVTNGAIALRPTLMENVVPGPLVLQLFQEVERPLRNLPGGGRLSITYGIGGAFTWAP